MFTLYVSHYSVKPLVSRVSVSRRPSPTLLLCLSGLRSVVPGHWLCISTGSRWHKHSSGVHNKQIHKQPLASMFDVSHNAVAHQTGGFRGSKSEEVIWFWPYSSHPWRQPPRFRFSAGSRGYCVGRSWVRMEGGAGELSHERSNVWTQAFMPGVLPLKWAWYL